MVMRGRPAMRDQYQGRPFKVSFVALLGLCSEIVQRDHTHKRLVYCYYCMLILLTGYAMSVRRKDLTPKLVQEFIFPGAHIAFFPSSFPPYLQISVRPFLAPSFPTSLPPLSEGRSVPYLN